MSWIRGTVVDDRCGLTRACSRPAGRAPDSVRAAPSGGTAKEAWVCEDTGSSVPTGAVVFVDAPAGIAAGLAAGSTVIAVATTHSTGQLEGATFAVSEFAQISIEPYGNRWRVLSA